MNSIPHYKNINIKKVITHNKAHPDRLIARRLGKSVPLKKFCEKCNGKNKLQRHHPDYSKPLYIITLCRNCHIKEHYKTPSNHHS